MVQHLANDCSSLCFTHANNLPRASFKGVMTRSVVDALSELWSPFLNGGNSAFIAAMASGIFPQSEYRSFE